MVQPVEPEYISEDEDVAEEAVEEEETLTAEQAEYVKAKDEYCT